MTTKSSAFNLTDAVGKSLYDSRNAPKDYVSKPGLKPSELGSPCLRKIYYSFHKVPSNFPWEVENIKAAEAGDAFHAMFRGWLKRAGLLIENLDRRTGEVPLSFIDKKTPDPEFPVFAPDLGVRYAKVDGIVKVPEGNDRSGLWILEVKSKAPDKMHWVKSPDRDRYQGTLYAFVLEEALREGKFEHIPGLTGETDIRGTVYVYIDRATGDWKEFWEEKNPEFMGEVISKALLVLDHVERKALPPKTKDFCNWCSWRDKCALEYKVEA